MSALVRFEKVATDDGSVRYLCSFSTGIGMIQKSVLALPEFVATASKRVLSDFIAHQVEMRSRECDRHEEHIRAKKEKRVDTSPKHLYEQALDPKLFDKIKKTDIDAEIGA